MADKPLQQQHLVLCEVLGLQVVQDHGVIAIQLVGRFGEAMAKLFLVDCTQSQEHGFVVLLGRIIVFVPKPAEQRVGRLATAASKLELRLPFRNTDQSHQVDLGVILQGPAQELELPVRPAGDIKHAVRSASAIYQCQSAVVGKGGLLRFGRFVVLCEQFLFGLGEGTQAIETDAGLLRLQLESQHERFSVFNVFGNLLLQLLPRIVQQLGDHGILLVTMSHDFRHDGDRSGLEARLTDRDAVDADVLAGAIGSGEHGIDGGQAARIKNVFVDVGGVSVGEEQHSGNRTPLKAAGDRFQRRRQ